MRLDVLSSGKRASDIVSVSSQTASVGTVAMETPLFDDADVKRHLRDFYWKICLKEETGNEGTGSHDTQETDHNKMNSSLHLQMMLLKDGF